MDVWMVKNMDEDEFLDVVDGNNVVIGRDLKSAKKEKGFISRNVAITLLDQHNHVLLCRRSPYKQVDPFKLDVTACGHVRSGELYEEAAVRELREETGLCCSLSHFTTHYHEVPHKGIVLKFFTAIFVGTTHQEPKPNDEICEIVKIPASQLEEFVQKNRDEFCSGCIRDVQHLREYLVKHTV